MATTQRKKKLTSSLEDYLEAVWTLVQRNKVARVRDIAEALGVGMPSVTAALKKLSRRGLVNYDPYQVVTLTEAGQAEAQKIGRTHDFLQTFLSGVLGLEANAAEANACRMEHAMDAELLERLRCFVEFIDRCPRTGQTWVDEFQHYCKDRHRKPKTCRTCAAGAVEAAEGLS